MTAFNLHFMFDGPYFRNVSYLKSSRPDDRLRNAVIKDTSKEGVYSEDDGHQQES